MKLAITDGQRREAQPNLSGECLVCEATTIAKCGEKNIGYWAQKSTRNCDHWWGIALLAPRLGNQFPDE